MSKSLDNLRKHMDSWNSGKQILYYFTVDYWKPNGELTSCSSFAAAENVDDAYDKVAKRFEGRYYDITYDKEI